jgi:hypothetical protein
MGRGEREGPDGRRLGPQAQLPGGVEGGVVGELREFGVDVVPGEGVLPGLDEFGGYGALGMQSLLQRCQDFLVVPAFSHLAHPLAP